MGISATGQEGATVHVHHHAPGAVGSQYAGGTDQSRSAMRQPNRGANAAGCGRHGPSGEVDEAPWPRHIEEVATNCQGWPDGKPSGEPGKPASDARVRLHDFPNHP